MHRRAGLTMMEVLVALVVLGVVVTIFAQTSRIATRMTGRSMSWDQEGIALEKTIEHLRTDYTLPELRNMNSSWVDGKGQYPIAIKVKGSTPTAADCPGYPVARLAKVELVARRTTIADSIAVTTFILVP